MYESYSWPGAYSFKEEIGLFIRWFKKFFANLAKKIDDAEKKVS